MIEIGINPNIVTIGNFTIGWHGVLMVIAIIAAVILGLRLGKLKGFSEEFIITGLVWAIPSALVISRLVHVIDNISYYSNHPVSIFIFTDGGLSLYGGLIGGVGAGIIYALIKKRPLWALLDVVAPCLLVGQAVGRIGCLINGDAYGTTTSVPWGLIYTHPDTFAPLGIPTQPSPAYEMIYDVAVLAMLWRFQNRFQRNGSLFLTYLIFYPLGRFLISFTRVEPPVLGPLHQSHLISIIMFLIALGFITARMFEKRPAPAAEISEESQTQSEEAAAEQDEQS